MLALFAVPFLDEIGSGVTPVAAPDIALELASDPGTLAGVMIAAFGGIALFVEAPLLAWSECFTVRRVSIVSLCVLAVSLAAAAIAPDAWMLLAALALYGPAAGCALAVAEGALVEARPHERERTLARMTLAGEAGDLAVPLLLAGLAWVGLGWRTGLACAAGLASLLAIFHLRSGALEVPSRIDDDEGEEDEEEAPMREALRTALGARSLLRWSALGSLTGLLDEVLVAFAAVHLAVDLGAGAVERAIAIGAWTLGGLLGVAALERIVASVDPPRECSLAQGPHESARRGGRVPERASRGVDPLRVLRVASVIAAASLLVVARTEHVEVAIVALAVLGASSSALHPLLKARAYAALPGRPAIVNAVASALSPVDVLAPLLLAWLAAWGGSRAALCAMLVAPLLIASGALAAKRPPDDAA